MNLKSYLDKKGQEYAPFDPLRAPRIFLSFERDFLQTFKPKVIHIVGTNGKGSTGRYIALALARNFKIMHFTSPHLFQVNERFYFNEGNAPFDALEQAHQLLSSKTYMQEASFFEYLTFLGLYLARDLDFLILEAGLGGEFDSTNVIKDKISVFTQIGFDHLEILGGSIEQIAKTKLNSMGKIAFLGIQKHSQVYKIAKQIAQEKKSMLYSLTSYPKRPLPDFLNQNFTLAQEVLSFLGYAWEEIPMLNLKGRMQRVGEKIWFDVGHNIDGAKALAREFKGEKIILVYNSYAQKDIGAILQCFKPIIQRVEILKVHHLRIIPREKLEQILGELKIDFCDFSGFKSDQIYLVFGSFSVVQVAFEWLE